MTKLRNTIKRNASKFNHKTKNLAENQVVLKGKSDISKPLQFFAIVLKISYQICTNIEKSEETTILHAEN